MSGSHSPNSRNGWAVRLMERLRSGSPLPTDAYWTDPGAILRAYGMTPDPWQEEVLTGGWNQCRLCCGRQVGKTTTMSALAVKTMLVEFPARVVVTSPSEKQSAELLNRHVKPMMEAIGWPVPLAKPANELSFELENGSLIEALPGNERTNRGISSARLLIVDEASRVGDDLYKAMKPVVAMAGGRVIAGTTPFGKRGWFFDEFSRPAPPGWHMVRVKASMCARYPREFLDAQRAEMGERWFNQEYEAGFEDMVDAVFSGDDIDAALSDFAPLF